VDLAEKGPAKSGLEATVDWLEQSAKGVTAGAVCRLLAEHLGPQFGREGVQVLRDDEAAFDARGPLGLRVRADKVGQLNKRGEREPWAGVRMPGELCRTAGTERVLDLSEAMGLAGIAKVSRLDLACDDFDRRFSPRQVATTCVDGSLDDEKALLGPQVVSRVKRENWEWSRRKGGCFWIGGNQSDRRLRVYDKARESGGRIESTRVELQCRNRFATALTERLLLARWTKRPIAEVFFEHLVEFIDLREAVGSRSGSQKWRRVKWWAKFVGGAKGVPTPGPDPSGVSAWIRSMRRQCAGFASVMLRDAGLDEAQFEALVQGQAPEDKLVAAILRIVGGKLPELSPEHELRLQQLKDERARRERLLARGRP
jgi:hypothetical protein